MTGFKDYFSDNADRYQQYRPTYPNALFAYLSQLTPSHQLAWDCATGNGQAAIKMAKHFTQVIATDASQSQIDHALKRDNIVYALAGETHADIHEQCLDLITIAQALHWLDNTLLFNEVDRVLKPNGILAVWSYSLLQSTPKINSIIKHLYNNLQRYWPSERRLVEQGYRSIQLPYPEIKTPTFSMSCQWDYQQLIGYLNTWSAIKRYRDKHKKNPLEPYRKSLGLAWGNEINTRTIHWPITLKTAIKPGLESKKHTN